MKVSKQFGTGKMKDLDIHLYDYGDDIIRINIDDDSDGKSTRFKIPFTPQQYTNSTRKIIDYIKFPVVGQEFFLYIHSAKNPANVYYKIEASSLLFGP